MVSITDLLLLSLLLSYCCSSAFLLPVLCARRSVQLQNNNLDLDGIGSQKNDEDGAALAREFYQQLKKRQDGNNRSDNKNELFDKYTNTDGPSGSIPSEEMLNEQEARDLNRQAFSRRREVVGGVDVPTKKFTGQQSAGFFSGNGPSVNSVPLNRNGNSNQRMRQDEMNLANRAEQSLLIQGGVVILMLCFCLYIGFSGGIEANSAIEGIDPASIEGMETMIPLPTDIEASVWL